MGPVGRFASAALALHWGACGGIPVRVSMRSAPKVSLFSRDPKSKEPQEFKALDLEVDLNSTIGDLKMQISQKEGIPTKVQTLIFAGKVLQDSLALSDSEIEKYPRIILYGVRPSVPIDVKSVAWETSVEVYLSCTVGHLKERIMHVKNIPVRQQSLYFGSQELEDSHMLSDYNIQERNAIWMHTAMWTGMPLTDSVYHGETQDGRPHGHGKEIFADGRVYEGVWERGSLHSGTLTDREGDVYEGGLLDGRRHGHGKKTYYRTGCVLKGLWEHGELYNGTKITPTGKLYEGGMRKGQFRGHGKLTFTNGVVVEGVWERGSISNGKKFFPDGSGVVYEGQLLYENAHGNGTRTHADGKVIEEGVWEQDKLQRGTKTYPNGNVYKGRFLANVPPGNGKTARGNSEVYDSYPHGDGQMAYFNGEAYQGEFLHGWRHGYGTTTGADGKVIEGVWEHGKLCGQVDAISAASKKCQVDAISAASKKIKKHRKRRSASEGPPPEESKTRADGEVIEKAGLADAARIANGDLEGGQHIDGDAGGSDWSGQWASKKIKKDRQRRSASERPPAKEPKAAMSAASKKIKKDRQRRSASERPPAKEPKAAMSAASKKIEKDRQRMSRSP